MYYQIGKNILSQSLNKDENNLLFCGIIDNNGYKIGLDSDNYPPIYSKQFKQCKDGIIKVSPFYHWTDQELDNYLNRYELPNEFTYFDPTKVLENRECGLHS